MTVAELIGALQQYVDASPEMNACSISVSVAGRAAPLCFMTYTQPTTTLQPGHPANDKPYTRRVASGPPSLILSEKPVA